MPSLEPYSTLTTLKELDRAHPALGNAAVAYCCKTWKRAYRAAIDDHDSERWASNKAGEAFRAALPPLTTPENRGDFVACVAHGILIGAISEKHGGKLLYAVQIAQAAASFSENAGKSTSNATNSTDSSAKRSCRQ